MAAGLPVVTSELVARGIGGVDGEHLLVGERPEVVAQHVIRLLRDPELARRIAGRRDVPARGVAARVGRSRLGERGAGPAPDRLR